MKRPAESSEIVVVTSGKGGVGKTTTAAAIGAALALSGKQTLLIDFDVGLRNLDLIMGCERRVVYDLINVIQGEATLSQATIEDRQIENLYVLPASQTRDKDALTEEGVLAVLEEASERFDYIICDSPAGIEQGALMAMRFATKAVVVTNPEVSSVRDSDRIVGTLRAKTWLAEHGQENKLSIDLLVTRYDADRAEKGEMLQIPDVQDLLGLNLIGIIPEDKAVLNASNKGRPVVIDGEATDAGIAYFDAAERLTGIDSPVTIPKAKARRGFWSRLVQSNRREVIA